MCAMVSNRPGRACKPGTELIRTETLKEGKKVTHRRDVTSGKERVCVCARDGVTSSHLELESFCV